MHNDFAYVYSAECTVTITNAGQVPIEMVELSVQSALDALTESKIFKWSDENLMTQLPLQPGSSASLTLYLYAATDFVAPSIRNGNIINYITIVAQFFKFSALSS